MGGQCQVGVLTLGLTATLSDSSLVAVAADNGCVSRSLFVLLFHSFIYTSHSTVHGTWRFYTFG